MKKLLFREWFIVLSVLAFISSLFLMESFSPSLTSLQVAKDEVKWIEVYVDGAVKNPGIYLVAVGTSVKSILEKAGIQEVASLKSIYLQKKLLSSCSIWVPEKELKKMKKKRFSRSMESVLDSFSS